MQNCSNLFLSFLWWAATNKVIMLHWNSQQTL